MIPALILLGAIVGVGLVLYLHHRLTRPQEEAPTEETPAPEPPEGCCGRHAVCRKDSLLAAASESVEYYDDEELDRFAGKAPGDYTEAEADEFREVMLTMAPTEVAGWARSLQLRGIELPEAVREELLLIVVEQRGQTDA